MPLPSYRRQVLAAIAVVAAVVAVQPSTVAAGPVSEQAAEAEDLLRQDKALEALGALERATDAFWQAAPLDFRVVTFAEAVTAFGSYMARADARFRPGETATIYLEPIGYGFTRDGDGFGVRLTTGVEIRTPGGLILARSDDFGDLEWRRRVKVREVHATVRITLPALKTGDYFLLLRLGDRATAKSAVAVLAFTIVE